MRSGVRLLVFAATLSAFAIAAVEPAPGGPTPTPAATNKSPYPNPGRTLWQFETGG